jgi:hypothetical protein
MEWKRFRRRSHGLNEARADICMKKLRKTWTIRLQVTRLSDRQERFRLSTVKAADLPLALLSARGTVAQCGRESRGTEPVPLSRPTEENDSSSEWVSVSSKLSRSCLLLALSNYIVVCLLRDRLCQWSVVSGQSSWVQIQRSGFDSRRYQILWEVVGLERGPLNLMSTIEELLGRKSSGSGLESREYGRRGPVTLTTLHPLSARVCTNFVDKRRSLGLYSWLRQRIFLLIGRLQTMKVDINPCCFKVA